MAKGAATFSLAAVQEAAEDALAGRVASPVGAIQIESPVRRRRGERFDCAEMQR